MMTANTNTHLPPMRHSPPQHRSSALYSNHHHHQQQQTERGGMPKLDQNSEPDLSLSDEDMLLCSDDDEDAWSGEGSDGKHPRQGSAGNRGRSRRLLSVEQSKVLYKILEKTHFPSTQLREQVATQLCVSPRKVQVWFQNRRQVGKKRMMEAVQSILPPSSYHPHSQPYSSQPPVISLEMLQEQMKATGKGRFNPAMEDERTRAWRKHTIRLALNPGSVDEEEPNPLAFMERGEGSERRMQSLSRATGGLRINIPSTSPYTTLGGGLGVKTPLYTGPGSATHLETLRSSALPPLTPATVRTSIIPPAVSSQKESFSLYNVRHYPHQPYSGVAEGGGGIRGRSLTLASPSHLASHHSHSVLTGVREGEAMKEVRTNLTLEWWQKQQLHLQPNYSSSRYGPMRSLHPQSGGERYRSSTETLTRLPLPSPRPSIAHGARQGRYSPYNRPTDLPPPLPSSSSFRTTTGSLHLLPPNLSSTSGGGRGRSVSSPHQPPHPISLYPGGHSHSSSIATTSTTATSLLFNGTTRERTPSTANTSIRSSPIHNDENRSHQDKKMEQERVEREARGNPMDVRSLTTSNFANVSRSRGGSISPKEEKEERVCVSTA